MSRRHPHTCSSSKLPKPLISETSHLLVITRADQMRSLLDCVQNSPKKEKHPSEPDDKQTRTNNESK